MHEDMIFTGDTGIQVPLCPLKGLQTKADQLDPRRSASLALDPRTSLMSSPSRELIQAAMRA